MKELIEVGVIESKTYVWREGLDDWLFAKDAEELISFFGNAPKSAAIPPPMPSSPPARFSVEGPGPFDGPKPDPINVRSVTPRNVPPRLPSGYYSQVPEQSYVILSDKSRSVAGVLNFLPGFGRFYLGYGAIGFLQLFTVPCGIGIIWSWIDAIGILAGACPLDGYGRKIVK